jgi:hypothetical protein
MNIFVQQTSGRGDFTSLRTIDIRMLSDEQLKTIWKNLPICSEFDNAESVRHLLYYCKVNGGMGSSSASARTDDEKKMPAEYTDELCSREIEKDEAIGSAISFRSFIYLDEYRKCDEWLKPTLIRIQSRTECRRGVYWKKSYPERKDFRGRLELYKDGERLPEEEHKRKEPIANSKIVCSAPAFSLSYSSSSGSRTSPYADDGSANYYNLQGFTLKDLDSDDWLDDMPEAISPRTLDSDSDDDNSDEDDDFLSFSEMINLVDDADDVLYCDDVNWKLLSIVLSPAFARRMKPYTASFRCKNADVVLLAVLYIRSDVDESSLDDTAITKNGIKHLNMLREAYLSESYSEKGESSSSDCPESVVQAELEKETGCGHADCEAGRIDVLTPDTIIEIKRWTSALQAVRQVNLYATCYANKKKRIHLFGHRPTWKQVEKIRALCTKNNITITERSESPASTLSPSSSSSSRSSSSSSSTSRL